MESIAAITGLADRGALSAHAMRPPPVEPPLVLADRASPVRTLDPVAGVRRAEAMFAKDDAALVRGLTQIDPANFSIASLYQLQVRTILFKVKHEAVTGIVTNLNQSMKTILNAA
ncbi:hypothetical protein [Burkholderia ambifaria]|uniref:Uncharacterized protein n=1 Tax=Burkholderia ambifaria MEX-5 TaxID=396597 RepID=B1T6T6_9BURK|nr:hypothetical protein [Burkholderia ambifaria]EDT40729.1 hypothetical protein BamMEX5DRAFT_3502 [Burkholderia ambifaria MEX-5]